MHNYFSRKKFLTEYSEIANLYIEDLFEMYIIPYIENKNIKISSILLATYISINNNNIFIKSIKKSSELHGIHVNDRDISLEGKILQIIIDNTSKCISRLGEFDLYNIILCYRAIDIIASKIPENSSLLKTKKERKKENKNLRDISNDLQNTKRELYSFLVICDLDERLKKMPRFHERPRAVINLFNP